MGLAAGCGGGQGGGRLSDLPAPAGARRRRRQSCLQRCGIDGGVADACGGVSLFVSGGEVNEMKKLKKTSCLRWPPTGQTHNQPKHAHATQEVKVRRFDW